MIYGLSALQPVIAALRKAIAAPAESTKPGMSQPRGASSAEGNALSSGASTQLAMLPWRIASLSTDDPRRRRQGLRLFIEALLLDEFGPALITDPGFQDCVERTASAIEEQPALQATLDEALAELMSPRT